MCSFPKLSNRSSTYALFCLISLCASFFIFLQILWHFWSFDFLTCKKFVVRYDYELYLKIQRRNSLVLHKINRWVISIICRTSSSELLVHVTHSLIQDHVYPYLALMWTLINVSTFIYFVNVQMKQMYPFNMEGIIRLLIASLYAF